MKKKINSIGCALLFTAVLVAVLLSLPAAKRAKAASQDFRIDVTYGVSNQARFGKSTAFNIEIGNDGNDFNGFVQVIVYSPEGNNMYEKDLSIARSSSKTVTLYVPVSNYISSANIRILNSKGKVVANKMMSLSISRFMSDLYMGVLSDDFSALSYAHGVTLLRFQSTDVKTNLIELNETTFPSEPDGMDMFDMLLITNFSTDRLSDNQLNALNEWVSRGGIVIAGTGSTVSKTFSGLKNISAFDAVNTSSVSYTDYKDTSYGLNITSTTFTGIPQYNDVYNDPGADWLEWEFGSDALKKISVLVDEAIADALETDAFKDLAISQEEYILEKIAEDNQTYFWSLFGWYFGYDAMTYSDENFMLLLDSLKYSELMDFIEDRLYYFDLNDPVEEPADFPLTDAEITSVNVQNSRDIYGDSSDRGVYAMARYYRYGAGIVIVAGFDFTQNPLAAYKQNSTVLRSVILQAAYNEVYDIVTQYYYNAQGSDSYINNPYYDITDPLGAAEAPPVLLYVLILSLYLVSIFVSFSILKKKRKNILFWVTQVGLAIIFGLIIFLCGLTTRLTSPELRVARLKQLKTDHEENTEIVSFVMPSKKTYRFSTASGLKLSRLYESGWYFNNNPSASLDVYRFGINTKADINTYILNNQQTLNVQLLSGTRIIPDKSGRFLIEKDVQGNVTAVTNCSGYDLEKVFVIENNTIYFLGDINNGEQVLTTRDTLTTNLSRSYSWNYNKDVRAFFVGNDRYGAADFLFGSRSDKNRRVGTRLGVYYYTVAMARDADSPVTLAGGFINDSGDEPIQEGSKIKEWDYTFVYQFEVTGPDYKLEDKNADY